MTKIAMTSLALLGLATPALAASTPQQVLHDPNRPVAAVAGELGVTPLQFATCFAGVTPARTADELNGARERDNKAILLPCLQAINPAIDNARLDAVMDKYRGGAPAN
ncbi:hypothetical protein ASD04_09580 [Devosia sp. Root436]|jgi:hypothetical protein|uniref:hypothetical protein n=1 Tax=Devosia sp. Root436 TaxID=1736537 RepID=UPI0006F3475D|nr:hypothetical protein [Devosia sp. Root436]KQX38886.1 hypothetical protein ASD04_09580 [Devosia sp. Root436]